MSDKKSIRDQILAQRTTISHEKRHAAGKIITWYLQQPPVNFLMHPGCFCIYLSMDNEIPTRHIARIIWQERRAVCVPVWQPEKRNYTLSQLAPKTPLITGHYGVREPAVQVPQYPWEVGVVIVPGLAFDSRGARLGFGAGYYDRILAQFAASTIKIAICYDWQIIPEDLPQESHDIPMDWIVTDKRTIRCATRHTIAHHLP